MRKLSGRFEPSGIVGTGPWTFQGNFIDETGNYGPGDVVTGNRIFLYDTLNGVMRYKVVAINTASNPMSIDIDWDDEGTAVEPPLNNGFLCAVSPMNLLPEEPSFQQQLLDENLTSGMRAQMNRTIIDTLSTNIEFKANSSGTAIAQYDAVSEKADGTIEKAAVTSASAEVFYGIALEPISDGSSGKIQVAGEVKNAVGSLSVSPETPLYVSSVAGQLSSSAPEGAGQLVMRAGYASGSSGQHLLIDKKKIVRN